MCGRRAAAIYRPTLSESRPSATGSGNACLIGCGRRLRGLACMEMQCLRLQADTAGQDVRPNTERQPLPPYSKKAALRAAHILPCRVRMWSEHAFHTDKPPEPSPAADEACAAGSRGGRARFVPPTPKENRKG